MERKIIEKKKRQTVKTVIYREKKGMEGRKITARQK
jgi:hypothetical protein